MSSGHVEENVGGSKTKTEQLQAGCFIFTDVQREGQREICEIYRLNYLAKNG